ncbi:hypothetical protein FRC08_004511 [Ceratobasidium sp. 394]|nr:hypothetical protein FRC08_004511 [Ceratobasidium sp. 394]
MDKDDNPFDAPSGTDCSSAHGDEIDYIGDLFIESSISNNRNGKQLLVDEEESSESEADSEIEDEIVLKTADMGFRYLKPASTPPARPPWPNKAVCMRLSVEMKSLVISFCQDVPR